MVKVKTIKNLIIFNCNGLILSYILYLLLIINKSALNPIMMSYLSNKYLIVFGQWFLAILLGNLFGCWYIFGTFYLYIDYYYLILDMLDMITLVQNLFIKMI